MPSPKDSAFSLLAPLHFEPLFWEERLDWARGWRRASRKHRPGIPLSSAIPKAFPQREAEGLRPRPEPWKDHRLVVPRSAPLSPRPSRGSEVSDPLSFLQK